MINNDIQEQTPEALISIIQNLRLELNEKEQQLTSNKKLIAELFEQLRLQRYRQFASKSEKYNADIHQPSLFDEASPPDNKKAIVEADECLTVASYERSKVKRGRKPLPETLSREQIIYDLDEKEKTCGCGSQLTYFGDEKSEQLEIIPAKIYVIEHIRKKYVCKPCEGNFKTASLPLQAIPKSIAGPGLLSHILVAKFQDHCVPRIHLI